VSSPNEKVLLSPGVNQLQIVIDDKPGVITGTVTDGDMPAANAQVSLYPKDLPLAGLPLTVPGGYVRTGNDGKFQVKGLTPGEYRIVAWRPPDGPRLGGSGNILPKLVTHAQSVTVERGSTSNVDLRLTDPSQ
jgi:Carboxypeptidase regulatory-like domain